MVTTRSGGGTVTLALAVLAYTPSSTDTVETLATLLSVVQGATLDGVISVVLAGGSGGTEQLTIYIGQLGTANTKIVSPDKNGNVVFSMKVSVAKGTQPISVSLGSNGEIRTLGTIAVR